jgi:hypothetical protein
MDGHWSLGSVLFLVSSGLNEFSGLNSFSQALLRHSVRVSGYPLVCWCTAHISSLACPTASATLKGRLRQEIRDRTEYFLSTPRHLNTQPSTFQGKGTVLQVPHGSFSSHHFLLSVLVSYLFVTTAVVALGRCNAEQWLLVVFTMPQGKDL